MPSVQWQRLPCLLLAHQPKQVGSCRPTCAVICKAGAALLHLGALLRQPGGNLKAPGPLSPEPPFLGPFTTPGVPFLKQTCISQTLPLPIYHVIGTGVKCSALTDIGGLGFGHSVEQAIAHHLDHLVLYLGNQWQYFPCSPTCAD